MKLDATRIASRLYMGGYPKGDILRTRTEAPFSLVVLCARELQHVIVPSGVVVIRAPLDDNPTQDLPLAAKQTAMRAAWAVAGHVRRGGRVLVTCAVGVNRSAFVAALALHMLTGWEGKQCRLHVQRARGVRSIGNGQRRYTLSNERFADALDELEPVRHRRKAS